MQTGESVASLKDALESDVAGSGLAIGNGQTSGDGRHTLLSPDFTQSQNDERIDRHSPPHNGPKGLKDQDKLDFLHTVISNPRPHTHTSEKTVVITFRDLSRPREMNPSTKMSIRSTTYFIKLIMGDQ
ncbi:hypothetical protein F2P81_023735 [Scophthalmus maximus]|uniref:Uncharacterized protein n=1 Tax=Scophthalmus maximus TaxID=52904 RepID=A0A6A4RSF8_SCOMX|nr:hypothetical protein F2P81_023735 [Scophthalmus maximus]